MQKHPKCLATLLLMINEWKKKKEKKSSDRLNTSDKHQGEKHLRSQTGRPVCIPVCLFQLCQCDWSSDVPVLPISLKCSSVLFVSQHLPTDMQMERGESERKKGAKSNILSRGIRALSKQRWVVQQWSSHRHQTVACQDYAAQAICGVVVASFDCVRPSVVF